MGGWVECRCIHNMRTREQDKQEYRNNTEIDLIILVGVFSRQSRGLGVFHVFTLFDVFSFVLIAALHPKLSVHSII